MSNQYAERVKHAFINLVQQARNSPEKSKSLTSNSLAVYQEITGYMPVMKKKKEVEDAAKKLKEGRLSFDLAQAYSKLVYNNLILIYDLW